jgi:multidrug efflux pump subunit AcrB
MKNLFKKDPSGQDRLLPKFSLFIFDRSRTAAILWLCLTVFGIFSYTVFLKREGFPSVNIPFSVATGGYIVNNAAKVDHDIAKPISDIVMKHEDIKTVQTQSQANFYSVIMQFEEGTDVEAVNKELTKQITDAGVLPKGASLKLEAPKFGFTERGDDAVVSVYAKEKGSSTEELTAEGEAVAAYIKAQNLPNVETVSVISPFVTGNDDQGAALSTQTKFDRYGERHNNQNNFYDSVSVGLMQKDGTDVIKMDDKLREIVAAYNAEHAGGKFTAAVSASYAVDIKAQISELQKALLEGLLAVLLIGSIVIAIRASIITVLSMVTVLAITIGALFLFGYTLNTITLFALILCLGLIVDDTIIMVEALDAQRRRRKDPRETVHEATRKVSRAMIAATSTAVLSFAPLLFVGGILGGFIRAIPVTVITSLTVSLLVALIFIPFFARYLLLGKKQMGAKNVHEPAAGVEAKIAAFICKPMLWARNSKKKLFGVGIGAIVFAMLFIGSGMFLFTKVTFNIFPPSKDTNGLMMMLKFDEEVTIQQAEAIADRADAIVAGKLGENFKFGSYYSSANQQTATMQITILPYDEREVRSPQLADDLEKAFKGFEGARVDVGQLDVGPPSSAFNIRINAENRAAAKKLARDINAYLLNRELTRPSGEKAKIISTEVTNPSAYTRADGKQFIQVAASFDGTDTSTLVTLAQDAVKKQFPADKVAGYGLPKDAINFDLGQEQENQDSFKALAMAFPILLLVIYLLLSIQFRSLLQPLLIFVAIPFSLFGITLGLYITDNAFSFFAMLGFFALIGLSLKNTILLTDYANQLRRSGSPAVDAAVGALEERFRPLIATSLTAVVSLIPLALSSPFWEGLAVVLIFGLLSSTFLVITAFPYFYLGAEYLRVHINRKTGLGWLALTAGTGFALGAAGQSKLIMLSPFIAIILVKLIKKLSRKPSRQ